MGKGRKPTQTRITLAGRFEDAFAKADTDANVFKNGLSSGRDMLEKGAVGVAESMESKKKSPTQINNKPNILLESSIPKPVNSRKSHSIEKNKGNSDNKTPARKTPIRLKRKKTTQKHESCLDLSCYGNGSSKNNNKIIPAKPEEPFEINISSTLKPNRSSFPPLQAQRRAIPDNFGNELNHPGTKTDSSDIIIGLDFGTSSVKIVIHDPQRQVFFAVPFYPVCGSNIYLYSCRVYLTDNQYSLDKGDNVYADLKLPLMDKLVDPIRTRHAIAFLALIIRHSIGWFLSNYHETYKNSDIVWTLNLGLPAAYAEDSKLSERFKQIALAAINLAGNAAQCITDDLTDRYLNLSVQALSRDESSSELLVHPDMVNVYPEISAQVVAFIESESWDAKNRPFITMVDIGAGTVDISFFSVDRKRGKRKFVFFKNSVEPNGVINLHRKRTTWLKKVLGEINKLTSNIDKFLDEISTSTDQLLSVPEKVNDYLENFDMTKEMEIDSQFFKAYSEQVFNLLRYTRQNRVPMNDGDWKRLPVFLCGGGSRMDFYRRIIKRLNERKLPWLHIELENLTKPHNLRAEGLIAKDYDRLSVAYGLSFRELGKIIPSYEVNDFRRSDFPKRERPVDPTDDG